MFYVLNIEKLNDSDSTPRSVVQRVQQSFDVLFGLELYRKASGRRHFDSGNFGLQRRPTG